MSLESVIYSRLSGYAGLAALVGNRIYPSELPEGTAYPAVTFWRPAPGEQVSGGGTDAALRSIVLQVDCWASDAGAAPGSTAGYKTVMDVAEQVLAALRRWRSSGDGVQATFVTNEGIDASDQPPLRHRAVEVTIWFEG